MIRRLVAIAFVTSFFSCAGGRCPDQGLVGALKPPPVSPIVGGFAEVRPPSAIEVVDYEILDAERSRRIPLRVYLPADARAPVIIFSHGLGSSRNGYAYLGDAWSRAGYVVVHVDHIDSNSQLSLLNLYRASYAPSVWRNRPRDISAVLDALERRDPLLVRVWEKTDLTHVGVAGHSFGAQTALNVAGVQMTFQGETTPESFKDARIDAVESLSVPSLPAAPEPSHFAPVQIPLLHMTGTKDESPAFDTRLCHKRVPFDWISGPPQWLVTMNGAVHRSFAGEDEAGDEARTERYHRIIVQFTTAFWDATLRDDARARDWLDRVAPWGATVERK